MAVNPLESFEKYYLRCNEEKFVFFNLADATTAIMTHLNDKTGSMTLIVDEGPRPWWQRFIFGLQSYHRVVLSVDWAGPIAGLIFSDENSSEYKARPLKPVEDIDELNKARITFGNATPVDDDFIVLKEEMTLAISQFLTSGIRPECFSYDFVF